MVNLISSTNYLVILNSIKTEYLLKINAEALEHCYTEPGRRTANGFTKKETLYY